MDTPARYPWDHFPDVLIHASERLVKQHVAYQRAKGGETDAAIRLVVDFISYEVLNKLKKAYDHLKPVLIAVQAQEFSGLNVIPTAMAGVFANVLEWRVEDRVIQANVVGHTGADGFKRLRNQAIFEGYVDSGVNYVLVDDFIGQGGTLANIRGHLIKQGGRVLAGTVLTGKPYSARLSSSPEQLSELRCKHGTIEFWWKQRFGFGFECLTASECRYLIQTPTSARIIERLGEVAG